ncbi:MAG: HAMP domain-containing histidine kinase [Bacteroidales bacterium]|nr:HAMP domain-containing histidine kinase [Bacteroidales bacterium]
MRINRLYKAAFWITNTRWAGIAFLIIVTFISKNFLNISIQDKSIYAIAVVIIIINAISYYFLKKSLTSRFFYSANFIKIIVNFQVATDYIFLTLILHFSGGIENPFMIVYIFHMILTGIILTVRESFFQTSFALILIGALTFLEYLGIIKHYPLSGFVTHDLYSNIKYLFWTGTIFISISYLVMLMTCYITRQLKKYEEANRLANIQLNEKDKIKNEYILKLTHDIKGHLAAILSCLDVLRSDIIGEVNKQQGEFITRVYKRTSFLNSFIKDLLKHTKMQLQNKLDMECFPLHKSIDRIIPQFKNIASEKSIYFTCEIDKKIESIYGNRISIEEVIENLLANAIEYTLKEGKVHLSIMNKKNNIVIKVSDTGIGIPENEQKNIFNEFYRGKNVINISPSGTGMGLPIVKQIAIQHKGKVQVKSEEGVGSTFTFTIPKKECFYIYNDI